MNILQGWVYELRPNSKQELLMRQYAEGCRFVFNKALALQLKQIENKEKKYGYAALCKLLTEWRHNKETVWLSEVPVHPLQQSLKDLERAWTNCFSKRAKQPRFKKSGHKDRFRFPDKKRIKLDETNASISLPKLGWIRYRKSRNILGEIRNATISASCGKWYVSIQTEREVPEPIHPKGVETAVGIHPNKQEKAVGIDVGIVRLATFSDGTKPLKPISSFKRHEKILKKTQQSWSRKKKGSKNWQKAKERVQRIYVRIVNVRRNYLHRATSKISKNYATVYVEDLKIKNMSRSAKGTKENPGKNVKVKSGLNKAILDQAWGEFRRQLQYKLDWLGGTLIAVPPKHTSLKCPQCGYVDNDNRKKQAQFKCIECGYAENADVVAAKNILKAGLALRASEASGAGDKPQAKACMS